MLKDYKVLDKLGLLKVFQVLDSLNVLNNDNIFGDSCFKVSE